MKTERLFMNGGSQAVRLPKTFRFEGTQVSIKEVGKWLMLLSYNAPWQTLFDSLDLFSNDFMETRDQPEPQVREPLFE